jgi:hypothetical protein
MNYLGSAIDYDRKPQIIYTQLIVFPPTIIHTFPLLTLTSYTQSCLPISFILLLKVIFSYQPKSYVY